MTSEERYALGGRIRRLRKERNMSLSELALDSGVSKGYLSQLERGAKENPSFDRVINIARALDVSVAVLSGEEPSPPRLPRGLQEFLDENPLTPKHVEWLKRACFRFPSQDRNRMTAAAWREICEMVRQAAEED